MGLQDVDIDTELDERINRGSDLPVLLMTAAHLTGDFSLLRPEWKPTPVFGKLRCDVSEAEQDKIVDICRNAFAAFRAGGRAAPPITFDALHRIAAWAVGKDIEPYIPLIAEEMVLDGRDLRRPAWDKNRIAPDRPFSVAIVGGGESGIIAAIRLKQAGVPFTLYEKNIDLGGTWLENNYPGCRVDINSYVYSYASAPHIWPEYFGQQPDVLEYLQGVASAQSIYEHVLFGREIKAARWDEASATWTLTIDNGGHEERQSHDLVVFAVGQLNRPALPDIAGRARFAGPAFHSARWDHSVDLAGKNVGVIGTGASACQFAPKAAAVAKSVSIFSRTTTWLLPTPELHDAVPDGTRWLMAEFPAYLLWYRASMLIMQGPGLLDRITLDPDYAASETAISESNDVLRSAFQAWIEPRIAARPDLRDATIPTSPVGAKRILRDNGNWLRTLQRNNVSVVRTPIREIVDDGIVTEDGAHHPLDVILYGTGFQASRFLQPIEIYGRDGADLHAVWGENPRAYLGLTVPRFPNMFTMYGPNTNLVVHGGSIILFSELSTKYIVNAIQYMLERDQSVIDVKDDIYDCYNARVDETNGRRAWGYSSVRSWYKNADGRVTQNYPFTIAEYWQRTNRFDSENYHVR